MLITNRDTGHPDFIIKNVNNNNKVSQLFVDKNILVENFDYFEALVRMNSNVCESILDLGLNSVAVKLCYNLIVGDSYFENIAYIAYRKIIRMLEIYSVLQCSNQTFLDKILSNLINRLDMQDVEFVDSFLTKIKDNPKISWNINRNIQWRMLYKINPSIYLSHPNLVGHELGPVDQKFILIIYPEKVWKCGRGYQLDYVVSSKRIIAWTNWGEIHNLNNSGKILQVFDTKNFNGHIVLNWGVFHANKIEEENGSSYIIINLCNTEKANNPNNSIKSLMIANTCSTFADYHIKAWRYRDSYILANKTTQDKECVNIITILHKVNENMLYFV